MKLLKNRQSGQALIMALIMLALGSLMVVPLLHLSFSSLKYHQLIESKTLENYAADSGVQYAVCKIYNDPNAYQGTPLAENFTINDRTVNVTVEYTGTGMYKITSTATSDTGRSTTIECYVTLDVGVFARAVAAKNDLIVQDSTVDSSPDPGLGNIHANGNIVLNDSDINGNAAAVGSIDFQGDSSVSGNITEGAKPLPFPEIAAWLYEDMAKAGGTYNGDYNINTSGDVYLGPLYIKGNLNIRYASVILEGTLYVTGNIVVKDGGHLEGEESIVSEKDISITGGGYGSENLPILVSTNGNIVLRGPVVDAVVYAQNGNVLVQNLQLYGAVGGKDVTVDSCTITYSADLLGREDLPGGELGTITYSFK